MNHVGLLKDWTDWRMHAHVLTFFCTSSIGLLTTAWEKLRIDLSKESLPSTIHCGRRSGEEKCATNRTRPGPLTWVTICQQKQATTDETYLVM